MTTEPFITLWYLTEDRPYECDVYCNGLWKTDWYAPVYHMPVREMLSDNTVALAEELVTLSAGSDWVQQYKRPLRRGDIFVVGDVRWLFAATRDNEAFAKMGLQVTPLPTWPDTSIVQIPKTETHATSQTN